MNALSKIEFAGIARNVNEAFRAALTAEQAKLVHRHFAGRDIAARTLSLFVSERFGQVAGDTLFKALPTTGTVYVPSMAVSRRRESVLALLTEGEGPTGERKGRGAVAAHGAAHQGGRYRVSIEAVRWAG